MLKFNSSFLAISKDMNFSLNCNCRFPRKFDDCLVPLEMKYLLAALKYRGLTFPDTNISQLAALANVSSRRQTISLLTNVSCIAIKRSVKALY